MPPVGIICWAWYEVLSLLVWHVAGVRPETDHCILRPRLLEGLDHLKAKFMLRGRELRLNVQRTSGEPQAKVNGKEVPLKDGVLKIPYPAKGNIEVEMTVREEKPEQS
jgi:cellobiose phosphorylase